MQLRKTPADDPATLADELVAARQVYIGQRNSVIERATARRKAVEELIIEHKREADELESIVGLALAATERAASGRLFSC